MNEILLYEKSVVAKNATTRKFRIVQNSVVSNLFRTKNKKEWLTE